MTGGGAPGAPGILRCLKEDASLNIFLADANPNAVGRFLHPQFISWPLASDPSFAEKVKKICSENQIQVLLPLVTRELPLLSAIKDELLQMGTRVLVSSKEGLAIANDKGMLYQHAQQQGISLPDFQLANTSEEWEKALAYFEMKGKPFVVKPCVSNGSRGFRLVTSRGDDFERFFKEKPQNTHIQLDALRALFHRKTFPSMLISDEMTGPEYSVDALIWKGEIISMVPRLRAKMSQGISVAGCIDHYPNVVSYCKQVLSNLPLEGNIGIQVKEDEQGNPLLLEINPRVQGTIVAGLGAGVNLPLWAVQFAANIKPNIIEPKWGVSFQRYWQEVFY